MPNRFQSSGDYRYGFNGMEHDDEVAGVTGSHYTAEFWMYDSRLGRRWNADPVVYPWQSPYATFNNNPIYFSDPSGLEGTNDKDDAKTGTGVDAQGDFTVYADEPLPAGGGVLQNNEPTVGDKIAGFFRSLDASLKGSSPMRNLSGELAGGYTLIDENAEFNDDVIRGDSYGVLDVSYLSAVVHPKVRNTTYSNGFVGKGDLTKEISTATKAKEIIPGATKIGTTIVKETASSIENTHSKSENQIHAVPNQQEIRDRALKQMGLYNAFFNIIGDIVVEKLDKEGGLGEITVAIPGSPEFDKYENIASPYKK